MKKRNIKSLVLNKLSIAAINFSEKIKGGSEVAACGTETVFPQCLDSENSTNPRCVG